MSLVVDIIGIIGFILSLINFVYVLENNRKKLNIRFGDMNVSDYYEGKDVLKVHFSFENESQLPISITRIQLVIEKELYDCLRLPVIIEEVTRKRETEIYDRDLIKSISVPINLDSLSAESGFLAFSIPQDKLSKNEKVLTFRICTNRGKAIQKSFLLHADTQVT